MTRALRPGDVDSRRQGSRRIVRTTVNATVSDIMRTGCSHDEIETVCRIRVTYVLVR